MATHNRAAQLPALVDALAAQDIEAPFEAIIVDDGSVDATWGLLERLARDRPWLQVAHRPINGGPATARNVGWRRAQAPIVAFTDDDCLPQPGWLRGLVAGMAAADLVQGATVPDPDQLPRHGPFGHTISVTAENDHYETCNVAYRRELLEELAGFDERYGWPMMVGEDVDLALRAKEAGARTAFRPDAVVVHDVMASDYRAHLAIRRRRAGFVLACRRHPQLRSELSMGYFTHPNAVAAAAATAFAAARPTALRRALPAAALLGRYAWKTMRETPAPDRPSDWLTVIPLRLVADLYEVSVTARASWRFRTLVL